MPYTDRVAAQILKQLREDSGLSPEALALEIRQAARTAPWGNRGAVDAHTIRRIEADGHIPGPRVRFVLAHYFDVQPNEIWGDGRLVRA